MDTGGGSEPGQRLDELASSANGVETPPLAPPDDTTDERRASSAERPATSAVPVQDEGPGACPEAKKRSPKSNILSSFSWCLPRNVKNLAKSGAKNASGGPSAAQCIGSQDPNPMAAQVPAYVAFADHRVPTSPYDVSSSTSRSRGPGSARGKTRSSLQRTRPDKVNDSRGSSSSKSGDPIPSDQRPPPEKGEANAAEITSSSSSSSVMEAPGGGGGPSDVPEDRDDDRGAIAELPGLEDLAWKHSLASADEKSGEAEAAAATTTTTIPLPLAPQSMVSFFSPSRPPISSTPEAEAMVKEPPSSFDCVMPISFQQPKFTKTVRKEDPEDLPSDEAVDALDEVIQRTLLHLELLRSASSSSFFFKQPLTTPSALERHHSIFVESFNNTVGPTTRSEPDAEAPADVLGPNTTLTTSLGLLHPKTRPSEVHRERYLPPYARHATPPYPEPTALATLNCEDLAPCTSLESLLFDDEHHTLLSILYSTLNLVDTPLLSRLLLDIFTYREREMAILDHMIRLEMASQSTTSTLFRSNSLSTNLVTLYTRTFFAPYLKNIIARDIFDAFDQIHVGHCNYEVDPALITPNGDLELNQRKLTELVLSIIESLTQSLPVAPLSFASICHMLSHYARTNFANSTFIIISNFIFLRFLCPAIVRPESYDITNDISKPERRMLLLVGKALQTIANDRIFGVKEKYLIMLNQHIPASVQKIKHYFDNVVKQVENPNAPVNLPPIQIGKDQHERDLEALKVELRRLKSKMEAKVVFQDQDLFIEKIFAVVGA